MSFVFESCCCPKKRFQVHWFYFAVSNVEILSELCIAIFVDCLFLVISTVFEIWTLLETD